LLPLISEIGIKFGKFLGTGRDILEFRGYSVMKN